MIKLFYPLPTMIVWCRWASPVLHFFVSISCTDADCNLTTNIYCCRRMKCDSGLAFFLSKSMKYFKIFNQHVTVSNRCMHTALFHKHRASIWDQLSWSGQNRKYIYLFLFSFDLTHFIYVLCPSYFYPDPLWRLRLCYFVNVFTCFWHRNYLLYV